MPRHSKCVFLTELLRSKILLVLLLSPIFDKCHAHFILLGSITRMIFRADFRQLSSLCYKRREENQLDATECDWSHNFPHPGHIACCSAPNSRPPATKALHTTCGNNTSIVSSYWWWAYKCPKHVEQIINAIKHPVASSWFSSLRLYYDARTNLHQIPCVIVCSIPLFPDPALDKTRSSALSSQALWTWFYIVHSVPYVEATRIFHLMFIGPCIIMIVEE